MSYNSRVALLVFLAAPAAQAASIAACPNYTGEHKLEAAQLFDGPPTNKEDLEPTDGAWDLTPYKGKPEQYFLLCHYVKTDVTKLVAVPATVSTCQTTIHAGATRVDCR